MQPKSVRLRILESDPTLRVDEIVLKPLMRHLPDSIADLFGPMTVDWQPNRSWGLSFRLGVDDQIKLGHRRGDHLATHPFLHGYSDAEAEKILRIQVGGTALHELGHALLDDYLDHDRSVMKRLAEAALTDGLFSDYRGMRSEGMSNDDVLHEMFAEAFRYLLHGNQKMRREFPKWDAIYDEVVDYATEKHAQA